MQQFFIWLLQVTAWFIPLYLLYLALFRRYTFFTTNRWYLLAVMILPLVLPLLRFTYIDSQIVEAFTAQPSPTVQPGADMPAEQAAVQAPAAAPATAFNWLPMLTIVYAAGFLWVFIPFVTGIFRLAGHIRRNGVTRQNGLRLVIAGPSQMPSSFFNYVFISPQLLGHPQLPVVLAHEKAHARLLHTADLLAAGLIKCLLWFNPFVWLHSRSLREAHEFEADRATVAGHDAAGYARLLLQFAGHAPSSILHPFSTRPVTTRINMLLTQKTFFMKRYAYLLLVPVLTLLLLAYGNISRHTKYVLKPGNDFVLMIDAGHGGNDPGAIVPGTDIEEKQINLALALQLKQQAEAAGIKVVMTRMADAAVPVKDRTEMAAREKASLILSLHTSMNIKTETPKSGIEFYAGLNNNPTYAKASLEAVNHLGRSLKKLDGISVAPSVMSRTASIWILKQAPCPSVLLECGYLNHAGDAAFLTSAEKREQMAKALLEGVLEYMKASHAAPAPQSGNAAVSLEELNNMIIYARVDNRVVLNPPEGVTEITATVPGGKVVQKGGGEMIIRVEDGGAYIMHVYGKKNGQTIQLGSYRFVSQYIREKGSAIPGSDFWNKRKEGC
jgi:N-acetylmuramoyl-L-alanine amidase